MFDDKLIIFERQIKKIAMKYSETLNNEYIESIHQFFTFW